MFDKGLREELTLRERRALALEAGPMRRTIIKERAVIALCDAVLDGEPDPEGPARPVRPAPVFRLGRRDPGSSTGAEAA